MSALLDDLPVVALPPQVRRRPELRLLEPVAVPGRGAAIETPSAQVLTLRAGSASAPLRLTRRGVAVLSAAVAVLAAGLIGVAWLSAPASASHAPAPAVVGNTVAVAPGDSLWSIAGRVAPNRDPRAEVADLQRLNHLTGSALVPGQVLRVH